MMFVTCHTICTDIYRKKVQCHNELSCNDNITFHLSLDCFIFFLNTASDSTEFL